VVEGLARLDAEVARSTGLDLDGAVGADLRALGFDALPAADPGALFDADAVRAALLDDAGFERAVESLWPRLTPEGLVGHLFSDPAAVGEHVPGLDEAQRSLLVRAPGAGWTDADAALLDEAASLLDGPPRRVFGHVVVDEAQELTAMQWRMVLRRCPARSMTMAGDFAQAGPACVARDWREALGPHLGGRFTVHTLTVN
jgi:hypothetical protein